MRFPSAKVSAGKIENFHRIAAFTLIENCGAGKFHHAGLLFCGFGKNIRITDGVFQNIGHNAGIAASHHFVTFQNIRGNTDCYRPLLFAPVTLRRQVGEFL
jgi:hypothetical protein